MNNEEYSYLTRRVFNLTNIDLGFYKDQQMRRRLDGHIARVGAASVAAYCKLLEKDRDALDKLRDFLTINVSEFFRDQEPFIKLRANVLPALLRENPALKVWSAGCSHGAEAYSVAILLAELGGYGRHQILGTDIDERTLARARAGGPYAPAEVKNVPKALLLKYFSTSDGAYWLNDQIRHAAQFKHHNLLGDPMPSGFDLVMCRNVIIYFSAEAKNTLFQKLARSLKESGVLWIGGTETVLDAESMSLQRIHNGFFRRVPAQRAPVRLEVARAGAH